MSTRTKFEITEVSILVTDTFRAVACLDLKQPRPIFTQDCKELGSRRGDLLLFINGKNIIGKTQLEVKTILFNKASIGKVVKFIVVKQEFANHENMDLYLRKVSQFMRFYYLKKSSK